MSSRLRSIDVIRGLAIIAMIQSHLWSLYIEQSGATEVPIYVWFVRPLSGYAAPLFTIISGMGAYLAADSLKRRKTETDSPYNITVHFVSRGGLLFLLATVVNALAGPITHYIEISLLNWGVIQLVGLCFFIVPLYVRFYWWVKVLFAVIPLFLSVVFGSHNHLLSFMFLGFAPPCPWAYLFFSGMLVGEVIFGSVRGIPTHKRLLVMAGGGVFVCYIGSSQNSFTWDHIANLAVSSSMVFVAIFVLLLVMCIYLYDLSNWRIPFSNSLISMGQRSLTIYYLQLGGLVLGHRILELWLMYPVRVSFVWFLPLLFGVLALIHLLVNLVWARLEYVYSIEWIINIIMRSIRLPINRFLAFLGG